MPQPRSSRRRYLQFVDDYRQQKLDARDDPKAAGDAGASAKPGARRREYLKDYLRWLWPHRYATAMVFLFALIAAGLQMVEPLFMRFIICSNLVGALKDYRQRILNIRVILALRRTLYRRFLHLPLPKLWEMKTGGILSRLTGDVETTTGLLQMAIVSPAISLIRLVIAFGILTALNWRLSMMALAIVPGVIVISFISARRIRPIYRSVRKDVEEIDGRVGETFSGIRVVRAFGRELWELFDY